MDEVRKEGDRTLYFCAADSWDMRSDKSTSGPASATDAAASAAAAGAAAALVGMNSYVSPACASAVLSSWSSMLELVNSIPHSLLSCTTASFFFSGASSGARQS